MFLALPRWASRQRSQRSSYGTADRFYCAFKSGRSAGRPRPTSHPYEAAPAPRPRGHPLDLAAAACAPVDNGRAAARLESKTHADAAIAPAPAAHPKNASLGVAIQINTKEEPKQNTKEAVPKQWRALAECLTSFARAANATDPRI